MFVLISAAFGGPSGTTSGTCYLIFFVFLGQRRTAILNDSKMVLIYFGRSGYPGRHQLREKRPEENLMFLVCEKTTPDTIFASFAVRFRDQV